LTINISCLSKTYKNGTQALQDINLCIEQGIFGLLGPNGAGKMLDILPRLKSWDSGSSKDASWSYSFFPRVDAPTLIRCFVTLSSLKRRGFPGGFVTDL
jgi:ABC-type Na+ transport system ATPase subunit NatA